MLAPQPPTPSSQPPDRAAIPLSADQARTRRRLLQYILRNEHIRLAQRRAGAITPREDR